ncbi:MAG TPA: HK97 gp10 family phage protein [Candidatus Dojkabacteria bacterium]|nr:HK97 gp10 family phage protein [Candidatus Dojkabacteria bacterium]
MADTVKFELIGAKEAAEALKSLNTKDKIQIYYKLNRKAANVVKGKLKNNAPSNKIQQAIKIEKNKANPTAVFIGFLKKVFYVRFLEYGTEIRTTRGKKGRFKKPAFRGRMTDSKKFIEKSHDEAVAELEIKLGQNYQQELNKVLKSELKRVNNKISKYRK